MTDHIDCVVVGAGVIGLAVGRRFAQAGHDVAVVEAEEHIGTHTSSRNSEVIHAGIYYPKDSLKARLCVAGKHALYGYCEAKGIPHSRIGKLIVATSDAEAQALDDIARRAEANGVDDLTRLDAAEVATREPEVKAVAALHSPSTGIIDSHEYMTSLQGDLENAGGAVVLRAGVTRVEARKDGFVVSIDGEVSATCRVLVNAAGLHAAEFARSLGTDAPSENYFARGHYFSYSGRSPFSHLIYPVPVDGGLGIHATNDLGGAARFGPDVEWIPTIDYTFPEGLEERFIEAIRRYFPGVDPTKLNPSYTGIRPKLSGPGEPAADFHVAGPETHGVEGFVNMLGIESPGLTASLAIADYAYELVS